MKSVFFLFCFCKQAVEVWNPFFSPKQISFLGKTVLSKNICAQQNLELSERFEVKKHLDEGGKMDGEGLEICKNKFLN